MKEIHVFRFGVYGFVYVPIALLISLILKNMSDSMILEWRNVGWPLFICINSASASGSCPVP